MRTYVAVGWLLLLIAVAVSILFSINPEKKTPQLGVESSWGGTKSASSLEKRIVELERQMDQIEDFVSEVERDLRLYPKPDQFRSRIEANLIQLNRSLP